MILEAQTKKILMSLKTTTGRAKINAIFLV